MAPVGFEQTISAGVRDLRLSVITTISIYSSLQLLSSYIFLFHQNFQQICVLLPT